MRILVRDNLGKDVTHEREWYINTDGKIFYYTGDIDGPLYVVDNDYTWEVVDEWQRKYWGERIGLEPLEVDYPSCCDGCSNNPKNGGSGICNCTLPYMQNPTNYAAQVGDACIANNIDGYVYFANSDNLNNHKADADRIAEAVERTKKYLR